MAVERMTTWVYYTKLKDETGLDPADSLYLALKFGVYVDPEDSTFEPYARLENCDFVSRSAATIRERVSATMTIQLNGEGTVYSINTGASVFQISIETEIALGYAISEGGAGPYVCRFSNGTHIPINSNETEFTFNITLTMRNGEQYTRVYPACGVVMQTMTGPTTVSTGHVSTYTLSVPFINEYAADVAHDDTRLGYKYFAAEMKYRDLWAPNTSGGYNIHYERTEDAYVTPYQMTRATTGRTSEFSFVPTQYSYTDETTPTGWTYKDNGVVLLDYYFIPKGSSSYLRVDDYTTFSILESDVAVDRYIYASARDYGLLLSTTRLSLTMINRPQVDENLRPEFLEFQHSVRPPADSNIYAGNRFNLYNTMMERYHGIVQGAVNGMITAKFHEDGYVRYRHNRSSGDALQYNSRFLTGTVTETFSEPPRTILLEAQMGLTTNTSLNYSSACADIGSFDNAGNDRSVTFTLNDSFGFTTVVTDTITVLPYHKPNMPICRAQRVSIARGTEGEIYTYNGVDYTPDETGEYGLVEWQIDVSPLNDGNTRSLRYRISSNHPWEDITANSYSASGLFVFPADTEQSYNILFQLSDDFHADVPFIAPMNTAYAMLDFKHGGNGVAMGKVSELDYVYDIHRNWLLKMPYNTMVQNYDGNGNAVNLYEWMQRTNNRINTVARRKDAGIFGRYSVSGASRWYDGNDTLCVPSDYGLIIEENKLLISAGSNNEVRTAGWMNRDGVTVTRQYLNVTLGSVYSFAYNTDNPSRVYRPKIFIMTTKPTTINQTTGEPVGTIVASATFEMESPGFNGLHTYPDNTRVGYFTWYSRHGGVLKYSFSFNMVAYQDRQVWIVVTAQCGTSPQLRTMDPWSTWGMYEASIEVTEIWQSSKSV